MAYNSYNWLIIDFSLVQQQYIINELYEDVITMINYNVDSYGKMLGNITEKTIQSAASCMSQCTGCMCNCRCSCSGGIIADVDWEEM